MPHLIPCFHEADLPLARQVLASEPDSRLAVVCPHLQERAQAQGLPVMLLQAAPGAVTVHQAQVVRAAALGLQQVLDPLLATIDPHAPGCGWLLQPLHALFRTALGHAALWRQVVENVPALCWHVPFCDSPFEAGRRSFLPALLLVERLQAADRRFRVLGQRPAEPVETALPDVTDPALGQPQLLVHGQLGPQDQALLAQALALTGRVAVGLGSLSSVGSLAGGPGSMTDTTPLPTAEPGLPWLRWISLSEQQARLPGDVLRRVDEALGPMGALIESHLGAYIASPKFRRRQARALVDVLRRQLVFSVALQQAWAARAPAATLLLWAPDAVLTGPLLSQARRMRQRVLMVGASQGQPRPVASPRLAQGLELQVLTHPLDATPVVDGQGRALPTQVLALPQPLVWGGAPVQPLRRLGVLLEPLSEEGLAHTDLDTWLKGLKDLNECCQVQGVVLHIRGRADAPMSQTLSAALGWPPERLAADLSDHSLTGFLAGCDACLAYGQPGPAVAEALRLGVPVWQVRLSAVRPVAAPQWSGCVVPNVSLAEWLELLQQLRADARLLWMAARDQHQAYLRQQAQALPLDALI